MISHDDLFNSSSPRSKIPKVPEQKKWTIRLGSLKKIIPKNIDYKIQSALFRKKNIEGPIGTIRNGLSKNKTRKRPKKNYL